MASMIIWVLTLAGSVAAASITVAWQAHTLHLVTTALVTLGIVAAAVHEHHAAATTATSKFVLAAIAARYTGLLWAWSALAAYVVYALILDWPGWIPAVVAMFVACGSCLFVALLADREAKAVVPDRRALLLASLMTRGQFALGAVIFGILAAWKQSAVYDPSVGDTWVLVNQALGTGAGLVTLTGYLIIHQDRPHADRLHKEGLNEDGAHDLARLSH